MDNSNQYKSNFQDKSFTNRWKLYCETDVNYGAGYPDKGIFNRFIYYDGINPVWNTDYANINNQLDSICEFWFNKLENPYFSILFGLTGKEILFKRISLTQVEYVNIRNNIRDRFLSELKQHLNSEQGWNL